MGRYSALVSLFACVALTGLVCVLKLDKVSAEDNFCTSPECRDSALKILGKMNTKIKPCDDFYQFACGNYIDKTQIPEGKEKVDAYSEISNNLQDVIAIERPATDPKYLKLPYTFYSACMNEPLIESLDSKPIHGIAKQLGGWPVIEGKSWDSSNSWTWQNAVKQSRRLGLNTNYLIDFSIGEDLRDSKKNIIKLDQPSIGLNREYLIKGIKNKFAHDYFKSIVDYSVLFGANMKIAVLELRRSFDFEIELAKITVPDENRPNPSEQHNLRSIKQLQEEYPYVDWLDYINALLPKDIKVDENEIVHMAAPSFFKNLSQLLKNTKKRIVANYMMWRIYASSVTLLSKRFRHKDTGQELTPRIDECLMYTTNILVLPVSSLYIRKHFNQTSKVNAMEMANNIRNAFYQMLDTVKWMDKTTRQYAKKKLQLMSIFVGYSDEILDDNLIEELYQTLYIDSEKFYESYLNLSVYITNKQYRELRKPITKNHWSTAFGAYNVISYFSPTDNRVEFTAGNLQGVFFNANLPRYMNYGAMGGIMGHEIINTADSLGYKYDIDGNVNKWWQPDTENAYWDKADCVLNQYDNYRDKQTGLNLDGYNTLNENLADIGGIKLSYLAYSQWEAKNGIEPQLPNLPYSPKQMFWISAAQLRCAKYKKESLEKLIINGIVSPNEFRVLGPLSQIKEFSDDFKCPESSPMNPAEKCQIW